MNCPKCGKWVYITHGEIPVTCPHCNNHLNEAK
jgi:DNA-directed RNA polymerase subunit RPC12/RpoP